MPTKFKVVARKNLSKGAAEDSKLYYAQSQSTGTSDFSAICRNIAAISTASEGDVEAVMTSLVFVAQEALNRGEIVDLGKLGRLRVSISSKGAEDAEQFTAAMIRKANIIFTPGDALRTTAKKMKYERITAKGEGSKQ